MNGSLREHLREEMGNVPTTEDVEYDVTFPRPGKHLTTGKEPIVYLLGWAGCEHRYLSKYGVLYEEQG